MGFSNKVIGIHSVLCHESGGIIEEIIDKVATKEWGTYTGYVCTTTDQVQHVPDSLSFNQIALSKIVMKFYQMAALKITPETPS